MSSFVCEHCGKSIIDTPSGYVTECSHFPMSKEEKRLASYRLEDDEDYPKLKVKP